VATDQEEAAAPASAAAPDPGLPEPPPSTGAAGAGMDSPAYTTASSFGQDAYGQDDPSYGQTSFGQESSYLPSTSYSYGEEGGYGAASAPEQEESPPVPPPPPPPPPPPYPAQLPYQRGASETTAFRTSPQARTATAAVGQRRRASLVVARLEPWSVMKFSFLMSLVAWVVLFVAVALLYFALSGLGVFHSVQSTLSGVTSSQGAGGFNLGKYISASKVLGYTMLLGAVNIVLITALSTIGAMIYNLVTHLGGGIEVTLRETD
jgi:hypothetical protein